MQRTNKIYSDFQIIKFLKTQQANFTEENIKVFANKFNADISRIRALAFTVTHSYRWL
jgi:hypothetical protein